MVNILVFNCGSSSLCYKLFQFEKDKGIVVLASGKGHRVGVTSTQLSFLAHTIVGGIDCKLETPLDTYEGTAQLILEFLTCNGRGFEAVTPLIESKPFHIDYVGHRFVHGGDEFEHSEIASPEVTEKLLDCLQLAPLHNPIALSVFGVVEKMLPHAKNYFTFDTAFHSTIPAEAATYALPEEYRSFHKFGFHGLSYQHVTQAVEQYLGGKGALEGKKMVICHLGTGGSSICATLSGRSVDTSMGFTPLPGLVMSTRCGDIDASIPLTIVKDGHSPDDVLNMLNTKSGLLGLSTLSSDLRDIYAVASNTSHPKCDKCRLAFSVCIHRLHSVVGSMIAVLGGVDILAFTDGLGVEMPALRDAVCSNFEFCGVSIDDKKNSRATRWDQIGNISSESSKVLVLVVPNDEELVIAMEGMSLADEMEETNDDDY